MIFQMPSSNIKFTCLTTDTTSIRRSTSSKQQAMSGSKRSFRFPAIKLIAAKNSSLTSREDHPASRPEKNPSSIKSSISWTGRFSSSATFFNNACALSFANTPLQSERIPCTNIFKSDSGNPFNGSYRSNRQPERVLR